MTSGSTDSGCHAAGYVRHGLALCAIPRGRKGPITAGWNLPARAITDAAAASQLTENIGLLHVLSGTMALDVDDDEQARAWLQVRGVDTSRLIASPDHVGIISGRAGRGKLLYRLPEGVRPNRGVTRSAG